IRLPFTGSILADLVGEPFFYLDYSAIQDLAQASAEGGGIFLRETGTKQILMIPVRYQTELTGILAIHTLGQSRLFHPKEVGLVMNMTEASQRGAPDKSLQTGPVKLGTAAEVARDILSANIEQQITLRISHDLWALCDPLRLRQVISNLFDNAAKYSPPGSHI